MRVSSMLPAVAAVFIAAGALAQQLPREPPPLTEQEALGLIELTPEEIAARLEARVNEGLPEETDLDAAAAAFEAYVTEALERVREEHGAAATDFSFDIDPSLWGTEEAAAAEGWTPEEYERAVAERRDAVAATVAALTTPEALRLIDRMAASAPMRVDLDPAAPIRWHMTPSRPDRFADGAVYLHSLLSRAARDAGDRDDGAAAVAHLKRLRTLARVLHERPRNLMSALYYISWIASLADSALRPTLASGALSADDCRALRALLDGVDCLAIGRASTDAEIFASAARISGMFAGSGALRRAAIEADWRLIVGQWASVRPAFKTPIGQGDHWEQAAAFNDELDEKGGEIAAILAPALMRAVFSMQIAQLQIEASIIMLALEEHRLDHGAHPETLNDLVPRYLDAVPIDPLTGEAFRYVRDAEGEASPTTGYTLYSIGSDMHDDGGAVHPDDRHAGLRQDVSESEPYDYIFNRPYPLPFDDPQ